MSHAFMYDVGRSQTHSLMEPNVRLWRNKIRPPVAAVVRVGLFAGTKRQTNARSG